MSFRPLQDRAVTRRIHGAAQTPGGFNISETAKDKPRHGETAAVGNAAREDGDKPVTNGVKAGDRILFARSPETAIKPDREDRTSMRENHILGVMA